MLKFKTLFGLCAFVLFAQFSFAQNATVRGQITDGETGEMISFANLFVAETSSGTTTDLDGFYSLELAPGTYNLTVSYVGYPDYKIKDLVLAANQEEILNIKLKVEGQQLETVVVTAKQLQNSLVALNTIRQKSSNLLDGMAAETIRQAGDGDAGEAIKRVTGVSVEGGKHVFIRGLGDRYSKTTLNGMDIPGLDPDRNSVELDIFPTNLVDNLIVYKTFSPDLAGDFTGGIVDITTKSFPEKKTIGGSVSFGYNPNMHFNSSFLGYEGSGTDFLGFDDGTRALPFNKFYKIPDPAVQEGTELFDIGNSFSKNLKAKAVGNNMNKGISFSNGNQFNKEKFTVGYNLSLSYRNNSTFYEDAQFNTYRMNPDLSVNELSANKVSEGDLGVQDVFWSAMAGAAIKFKKHKFILNAMRLQNGVSQAAYIRQADVFENPSVIFKDNLEYAQREITNFLAKGVHTFDDGKHSFDWSLSPTFIQVDEPDIRYAAFEFRDDEWIFAPAVGATVTRTFRNLLETSYTGKANYTLKFNAIGERESTLKVGLSGLRKMRTFDVQNYFARVIDQGAFGFNGDADKVFLEENLWNDERRTGTYIKGNFQPSNNFEATQQILAGYVMNDISLTPALKAIYGVRLEKADNLYTGSNNNETKIYDNEKVLDDLDLLPSLNLVYKLKEKMNLRAAFNRTLARPSFKEKSIAQIQDRISGRIFLGNIDLVATNINNVDLRWESFGKAGESISLGGFYKQFNNPIELVAFDATAPNNFQPVNVGTASVVGIEFEARKNLNFISPVLNGLSVAANVSLIKSEVQMKDSEYEARLNAARDGQTVERTRQMVGQSPYIVNATINYINREKLWSANMSYNVQGERLAIAGIGLIPDVYDSPFHSLNMKLGKTIGLQKRWKTSLSVNNILDSNRQKVYQPFEADSELFEFLAPGRTFSVNLSYMIK